jgi:hypothetical protein
MTSQGDPSPLNAMIEEILALSDDIRYVAVYRDGMLASRSRLEILAASGNESDFYEELLVNPTLLKLASQRGNIDCGGLDYLLVRYGNFYQFLLSATWGHVSVAIETTADPLRVGEKVISRVRSH